REGDDVTIVAYSKMVPSALEAADLLTEDGIESQVIDLRSLRPLDMDPIIASFKRTNRAVIAEEGWRSYGIGSEVSARIYELAFDFVDAPVKRVAQAEVPLPYNAELEQLALPKTEDIYRAAKEVVYG
ncbi:MAG: transketolase C-terminal domain-containing protein, partial [Anaerolineales bacterium]